MKRTCSKAPRWILVDDNRDMLEIMREMLALICGAEVVCFSSATDALKQIKRAPKTFAFVITDLEMPMMNGIEFRQALRNVAPELPVMLATGCADFSEEDALEHGFCCLLPKPSSSSMLRQFQEAVCDT
jgi:FixJ family two-component response regulator